MEYLKIAEGNKASPKREFRSRARNHQSLRSNILESIAQVNGGSAVSHTSEDGVVRMKLLVKKQDLKQMLELMRDCKSSICHRQKSYSPSSLFSLEQHLNLLRRKHILRSHVVKDSRRNSWTPALQSIPEER